MRYSFGDALADLAKATVGGAVFGTVLIYGATKVMAATQRHCTRRPRAA